MTDISPELVERANRARMENLRGKPLADHEYKALRSQVEVDALTAALSAVAPLFAAQAVEDMARYANGVYRNSLVPRTLILADLRERAAKLRGAAK